MGYADLLARTWEDNILFSALLELTYDCQLRCAFCYNDRGRPGEPLTTAEWLDLLAQLRDLQVLHLTLSGGEPLAHPDFFHIGAGARALGFVVRIKTNGMALDRPTALRLREEVDPFAIEVSLHGATPAVHDRLTGVRGSFERLMSNLAAAREAGLRVKLNCTLTRWNEHEIDALRDLAARLADDLVLTAELTPCDDGDRYPLSLQASDEARAKLRQLRVAQAISPRAAVATSLRSPSKTCGAASAHLTFDPFGNALPCVQWRRSLGNIRTSSVRAIWSSAEAEAVRRLTSKAATQGAGGLTELRCLALAQPGGNSATGNRRYSRRSQWAGFAASLEPGKETMRDRT